MEALRLDTGAIYSGGRVGLDTSGTTGDMNALTKSMKDGAKGGAAPDLTSLASLAALKGAGWLGKKATKVREKVFGKGRGAGVPGEATKARKVAHGADDALKTAGRGAAANADDALKAAKIGAKGASKGLLVAGVAVDVITASAEHGEAMERDGAKRMTDIRDSFEKAGTLGQAVDGLVGAHITATGAYFDEVVKAGGSTLESAAATGKSAAAAVDAFSRGDALGGLGHQAGTVGHGALTALGALDTAVGAPVRAATHGVLDSIERFQDRGLQRAVAGMNADTDKRIGTILKDRLNALPPEHRGTFMAKYGEDPRLVAALAERAPEEKGSTAVSHATTYPTVPKTQNTSLTADQERTRSSSGRS